MSTQEMPDTANTVNKPKYSKKLKLNSAKNCVAMTSQSEF